VLVLLLLLSGPALADAACDGPCPVIEDLNLVLARSPHQGEGPIDHRPDAGKLQRVYDANLGRVLDQQYKLTDAQLRDLEKFLAHWETHEERYKTAGTAADVPPELIAAIHWRESHGDFKTYLHQGDPLGRPAVHWPTDIPVFSVWEDAAAHALGQKQSKLDALEIKATTADPTALLTFAEAYNGLGYYNGGRVSPYVFSGTDQYRSGKFVADGRYKRNTVDQQLGVATLLRALSDRHAGLDAAIAVATPTLFRGDETTGVAKLQQLMIDQGYLEGTADGAFGGSTKRAVKAVQRAAGLDVDGIAGPATWEALRVDP
jgi:lysozyme family protein